MEIYKYELQEGLQDRMQNSRLAFACSITPVKDIPESVLQKVIASANPKQIDLFYFESILASVGWNNNDAVFDKVEMWKARKTPTDKPINFMHNFNDIIGHMTSSSIIVENAVFNDSTEDNIPDFYDIAVGGVIYKFWDNEEQTKRIANLISEIAEGKWRVSMECVFPRFDYAIITSNNQHKIVARNDDSSFLTKHLKFYGGTGEYNGNRIGMLMRDFVFSGKGIVDNPANKRSDITACSNVGEVTAFNGTVASINTVTEDKQEIQIMKYTEAQVDSMVEELAQLKAKASEQEKKRVEESNALLVKAQQDLGALQLVSEEKDKTIASLNSKVESLNKEVASVTAELEKAHLETVRVARLAKLEAKKVDKAKAESLVNKFSAISEELFDELVSAIVVAECDGDMKDKEEKEKEKAAQEAKEKEEAAKALEKEVANAKAQEPPLTSVTQDSVDNLRMKASTWMSSFLKSSKKQD